MKVQGNTLGLFGIFLHFFTIQKIRINNQRFTLLKSVRVVVMLFRPIRGGGRHIGGMTPPDSIASAPFNPVEKLVGRYRIEASQFPDYIPGFCPVAGKGVSDPEIVPSVGICWINAYGRSVL
jgi:hypothetical protein